MRITRNSIPALIALATVTTGASAMTIKVDGDVVTMSGRVVGHECDDLARIISRQKVRTVVLTASGGGNANAGYCVGELIRTHGISTVIKGRCASSCSRMWLGGVTRTLDGPRSRVGLHGNYNRGQLRPEAPARLRSWLPRYASSIDRKLMEEWINLPRNKQMMYFYNDRAEICEERVCKPLAGRNARNAGLSTR
jgi:hypothetical protein